MPPNNLYLSDSSPPPYRYTEGAFVQVNLREADYTQPAFEDVERNMPVLLAKLDRSDVVPRL